MQHQTYDVVVIGGGHAGCEAAWSASSVLGPGGRVALVTMDPARIGVMSCNPAIGGLAKGQIVREIDALGGLMGLAADASGIMFRMLNTSKGPAVRGPRAQCDKYAYSAEVQALLAQRDDRIDVIGSTVDELVVQDGQVKGARISRGSWMAQVDPEAIQWNRSASGLPRPVFTRSPGDPGASEDVMLESAAVVLTTGTFMRALMHTGLDTEEGGRAGEGSAVGISAMLTGLGFELGRLKTGTPPRLAAETLNLESLESQHGDDPPVAFSHHPPDGAFPRLPQQQCWISSTNPPMHQLIERNLDHAPMYMGAMEADHGPRYCPSIEDKVMRFRTRDSHHVFLEPESIHTNEIYCNGISTSLPQGVQAEFVRMMPGCGNATILRHGYAVEYDMVRPHQIDSTCMTKRVQGLYLAGQINGTSGYEEAAGQGLLAGLNAARRVGGQEQVRFGRDEAYIGVMMDDLVTCTPREPYRMFTSRAEYRLLLRADNADVRLMPTANRLGLLQQEQWEAYLDRQRHRTMVHEQLRQRKTEGRSLEDWVRMPTTTIDWISSQLELPEAGQPLVEPVMTEIRYEGYIQRQASQVRKQQSRDRQLIPAGLDPHSITGLRNEARDAIARFKPATMGQAGRLEGISPADLSLLSIAIDRYRTL